MRSSVSKPTNNICSLSYEGTSFKYLTYVFNMKYIQTPGNYKWDTGRGAFKEWDYYSVGEMKMKGENLGSEIYKHRREQGKDVPR